MNSWLDFVTGIAVFLGGGLGAALRWILSTALAGSTGVGSVPHFPWPTFTVNALGCLAAGALLGFFETPAFASLEAEKSVLFSRFLLTGFLGGFTTFSAFSLEVLQLWRTGHFGWAGITWLVSAVFLPLLAAAGFSWMKQLS